MGKKRSTNNRPDFKAMAKTRAEIKPRQEAAEDKKTRIGKATALVKKAYKEIDGMAPEDLSRTEAKELHHAAHNFIVTLSPAAGDNGDQEIIWLNPNALKDGGNPYPNSGDKSLSELAQSIMRIGMINPIEIDDEGVIITGHQRRRASMSAGIALVPVKVLKGLSPSQRVQRQVAENFTQRKGSAQNANLMVVVNRMAQDQNGDGK